MPGDAVIVEVSSSYHSGPVSDHFDGQRFFNRYGPTIDRSLADIWRWRRHGGGTPWTGELRSPPPDRPPPRVAGLRVVMVGHASLLIQVAGCNVLVDPVWSSRASPVGFAGPRRHTPPGIAFDDLPAIDTVLLTHSHYDHMDMATLRQLWARDRPRVVAPLGNDVVLHRAAPELEVQTGDWGERLVLAQGVEAAFCPANHWSSRSLTDRRRALWCGYALHTASGLVYVAGDTAWGDGRLFTAMRAEHGTPRVAILPIGAYAPRWFMASQHMNPAEAVRAFHDCGADQALGVHWGTFKLTDEGQDEPRLDLAAACHAAAVPPQRFVAMRPGEVWQPEAA